ncbi:phosphatase PAP2 family protein [Peribacillus frigoritolerans]|uniref:phosphatase PAP2 family protein n=1 Tax=Peribacillus frigoritolerans TaxID=450367 RepID=UPI001059F29D|nr:phosphatase PAP2 family protein [Peribacillus frigoritolerans]TDL82960.1 phosphatase PAP2 family protein [Peribacillus frigoritolerans]
MKNIALFLFLFLFFAVLYRMDVVQMLDNSVVRGAEVFRNDEFTSFFITVSDIGSIKVIYPLMIIASIFLLFFRKFLSVFFLWGTFYSIRFINVELKDFFQRERPSFDAVIHAAHYSFPSGHAMNSTAFYGFLCYLILEGTSAKDHKRKWWISMTAILVGLIGTSRIYLGVHYLFDILAGFSAGMVWLLILIKMYETINSKIDKTRPA